MKLIENCHNAEFFPVSSLHTPWLFEAPPRPVHLRETYSTLGKAKLELRQQLALIKYACHGIYTVYLAQVILSDSSSQYFSSSGGN